QAEDGIRDDLVTGVQTCALPIWVYDAVRFPFTTATHNPDFGIVRHAISIDEHRAFFRQNLFGPPATSQQDVRDVWFAGVHSDVGGSYRNRRANCRRLRCAGWYRRDRKS